MTPILLMGRSLYSYHTRLDTWLCIFRICIIDDTLGRLTLICIPVKDIKELLRNFSCGKGLNEIAQPRIVYTRFAPLFALSDSYLLLAHTNMCAQRPRCYEAHHANLITLMASLR